MDEDDDPETNQAGRSVNEPNNSSQMPFSAPPEKEDPSAKRETEGRRETRKRNASEPIQSSAKVADEKKTPTSIATLAPKGAEGAPPEVNLMETSDWADTTEMAEELGRITVRASLDPALKGAGETVNPIMWANVAEATTNPAKRPTPGAAPAAKKSKTSNGSGGRSQAKSAPKGAEAARRTSPVNKDAFELNKPSLIPPKVGAEQASASKGKSKKSSKKARKSIATKSVGNHPNRQATLRTAILGTGNEPSTSARSTMAKSTSQHSNVDQTPTDSSGAERC